MPILTSINFYPNTYSLLSFFQSLLLLLLEWLLDQIHQLAQSTKHIAEAKAPAADADGVDEKVHQHPVGDTEGKEDAKV